MPFIANVKVGEVEPKGRPLSLEEMQALVREAKQTPHLAMFLDILIGTACRPEAALELTKAQCDFTHGLINLNPKGREQTKKRRPTVRMPLFLNDALKKAPDGVLVRWKGNPVGDIKNTFRKARARAGLGPDVAPYSVRHTMARWLRSQGVDAWQVSAQLGHRMQGLAITERYAVFSPDHLAESVRAIDAYYEALSLGLGATIRPAA